MKSIVALVLITLTCSACMQETGGGSGRTLTKDECEAMVRKGWHMKEGPKESSSESAESLQKSLQTCTTNPRYFSRKEYDCVMSSSSTKDFYACVGRR